MKKDVLNRYERDSKDRIQIDISTDNIEDLYDNFDKNAPYIRRDLDQDLVDYLIDCTRELGNEPFSIRVSLTNKTDQQKLNRIRRSLNVYFLYLVEIEQQKIRQLTRRSMILFGIGVMILFLSVYINQSLLPESPVIMKVFGEGLTVAAWVSLWEALATFLIDWFPSRKEITLYQRLANAELIFIQT